LHIGDPILPAEVSELVYTWTAPLCLPCHLQGCKVISCWTS